MTFIKVPGKILPKKIDEVIHWLQNMVKILVLRSRESESVVNFFLVKFCQIRLLNNLFLGMIYFYQVQSFNQKHVYVKLHAKADKIVGLFFKNQEMSAYDCIILIIYCTLTLWNCFLY